MMIFSGPCAPKFIAEALVASEKVGEGGPAEVFGLLTVDESDRVRRDRGPSIVDESLGDGLTRAPQCGKEGRDNSVLFVSRRISIHRAFGYATAASTTHITYLR